MMIKTRPEIAGSEITSESDYLNRRQLLGAAGTVGLAAAAGALVPQSVEAALKLGSIKKSSYTVKGEPTSWSDATSYNNFYEFGTDKSDPKKKAGSLTTDPWSVEIAGAVEKPGVIALEDLIKPHQLEERVYRFRCVEAWSMVIPWVGVPLRDVLKRFNPTSKARYVAFETLLRPKEMPGQSSFFSSIDWPYVEGLRIDEAMNPLSLLAVGMYGKVMPNQNGAPIRLVVPWKYGFKSIKSIVKITLVEKEPPTTWNRLAPNEYGFYSNVNPNVDHPRWSQKSHRVIGDFFRKPTMMFNGYSEEVANLYRGMDLKKFY